MRNLQGATSDTRVKIPEESPGSNNYSDLLVSYDNVETTNRTGSTETHRSAATWHLPAAKLQE